jgi:hypothetical protein
MVGTSFSKKIMLQQRDEIVRVSTWAHHGLNLGEGYRPMQALQGHDRTDGIQGCIDE